MDNRQLTVYNRYMENDTEWTLPSNGINFQYHGFEDIMMIDFVTSQSLEIVRSLNKNHAKSTLFDSINCTVTLSGSQLLKSTLLQPLTDITAIESRLDAVEELISNSSNIMPIQNGNYSIMATDLCLNTTALSRTKLLGPVIQKFLKLFYAAAWYSNTEYLPFDRNIQIKLLKDIHKTFMQRHLQVFSKKIENIFEPDYLQEKLNIAPKNKALYSFAIQSTKDTQLEIAYKMYTETVNDFQLLIEHYNSKYNIDLSLVLNKNDCFDVVSELPCENNDELIPIGKHGKNTFYYASLLINRLNVRIGHIVSEIHTVSHRILHPVVVYIRSKTYRMYSLMQTIALLDVLLCFAQNATGSQQVRPLFAKSLVLKQHGHAIRCNKSKSVVYIVKNDVFMDQETNFQLITGQVKPNMSGKSTYMKQVAIAVIMAQTGLCSAINTKRLYYVSAEYAAIQCCHRLFFRNYLNCHFPGTSAFVQQLQEMKFLLHCLDGHSLILLDEMERNTTFVEAVSIAAAFCKEIVKHNTFVMLATHAAELIECCHYLDLHPIYDRLNGNNANSITTDHDNAFNSNYGLITAQHAYLPQTLMKMAHQFAQQLKQPINPLQEPKQSTGTLSTILPDLLQLARENASSPNNHEQETALRKQLKVLQLRFINSISNESID
ncbi:muts domain V-domain-containing protein [Syncephalis fuscata]|nr:muts domain V-domain-containing protein [Syncephalis fuscata]